ncbi:MAG: ABC transporter permease [Tissierellia bacterium]|nr:ABC transporter permease [Tissierellia bacterium]
MTVLKRDKNLRYKFSIAILVLIILISALAPIFSPYDPQEQNTSIRLQGMSREHLLGTDQLGRDMLSRAIYGGRTSILLALIATLISMAIGIIVGTAGAYLGGKADSFFSAIVNLFQSLPSSCLILAIAGIFGSSNKNLIIALSITSWAGFSRIVHMEVKKIMKEDFVTGLIILGSSDRTIIKHIFVNMIPNIVVLFATRIGRAILSVAALSFLGLGVQPPTPDWSVMINDARLYYRSSPHMLIVPGMFIFLTLFSINNIGDYLRDKFDVKSKEIII